VLDQRGQSVDDAKVSYSTSAPDVADVDATGTVHAKFSGSAVITAHAGDKQDSVPVEVRIAAKLLVRTGQLKVVGLPLGTGLPAPDVEGPEAALGEVVHFDLQVLDHLDRVIENATTQLALGTPSILELQPDGKSVKAIGYGVSAVAASTTAAPILQGVSITVRPPAGSTLVLDPPQMTLKVGEQRPFKAGLKGVKEPVVLDSMVQSESKVPTIVGVSPRLVLGKLPGKADVIVRLRGTPQQAILHVTVLPGEGPAPSPWLGAKPVH
jgi:hypothetical protein